MIGFLDELADEFHRGFAKFRTAGLSRLNDRRAGQEHEAEFHIRREGASIRIVPFVEGRLPFLYLSSTPPAFFQPRPYGSINSFRKQFRNLDLVRFTGGGQIGKIFCGIGGGILRRKNLDIAQAPETRFSDGVFEVAEIDLG